MKSSIEESKTSSSSNSFGEDFLSANVEKVPGGVYLCQCGEDLSCGACCGIYNFYFESRKDFFDFIMERTLLFDGVKRDIDSILLFGEDETKRVLKRGKLPFEDFHHCPFAGFMGDDLNKPGCLIHPLAEKNKGADYRGLSYYGGLACASYFCPTCYHVPGERKLIVRECFEDWFEYGLTITEDLMINNLFDNLEKKAGKILLFNDFTMKAFFLTSSFLKLKFNWPFKRNNFHPVNYFFRDIDQGFNIDKKYSSSKYFHILNSFKVLIENKEDLEKAETFIDSKLDDIISNINN